MKLSDFFNSDKFRFNGDIFDITPPKPKNFKIAFKAIVAAIMAVIVAYCATRSFYTVPLGSQAILFSFGRYIGTEEQGLHFKAPWAEVVKFDVQEVRRFEFGEKTEVPGRAYVQDESEQKMVTADSKILLISWVAQWKISDPYQYFITNNVEVDAESNYRLISGLAEADFRKEVASMRYEDILTTGKVTLSANAKARITNTFKSLGVGISIVDVLISDVKVPPSVQQSYNDVETAKQAKASAINEAEAYANKTVEEAKGKAQVAMNNAEAYKINKIADATAISTRLLSLNEMYVTNPGLVRTNLWYENVGDIMKQLNVVFVDGSSKSNIFLGDVPIIGR
ncbi:MAG: FtsH protease activity modulator HflK [Synergistaceae bacterium]|jgi:membrane protease subunit HflK|nr:FtsH protease activity modulator HflK [Synergistaceae bacterium]